MTEVTGGEVAGTFTSGMHAVFGRAGSAGAGNDAELNAAGSISHLPAQFPDTLSDRDHDDYIVTYCMCLHEPSRARAEQDPNG